MQETIILDTLNRIKRSDFEYSYTCVDCKLHEKGVGTYGVEKHLVNNPTHIVEITVKNVTKANKAV